MMLKLTSFLRLGHWQEVVTDPISALFADAVISKGAEIAFKGESYIRASVQS